MLFPIAILSVSELDVYNSRSGTYSHRHDEKKVNESYSTVYIMIDGLMDALQ